MIERMTESEITDIAEYIRYREQAGSTPHNERDNIGTMARMLTEIRNLRGELAESKEARNCPAVSAEFGPRNTHCVEIAGHDGPHVSGLGLSWFNLSQAIRADEAENSEE